MPLDRPLIQFWSTVLVSPDQNDEMKVEPIRGRLSRSPETLVLLDILYAMNTYIYSILGPDLDVHPTLLHIAVFSKRKPMCLG